MEDMGIDKFWLDRTTLITGATGLLGYWLTERLSDNGSDIVTLVRDWVPQSQFVRSGMIEKVKVVRGDIRDQTLVERIIGEYEINTVFHLAAQTIVTIANRNPLSTLDSNIRGTWTLLEACRRSPSVKQIIVASSDKAYGEQEQLPYSEEMPLQGQHPYDVSKSCADLITQAYVKTYGLPVAITRCGNFYGGGDLNWNRIVPGTIRSILKNESPMIRSDGKSIRDYIYVEDASEAYMLLAENLAINQELKGHAFNFSNENQISVIQLVHKIIELMGADLQPEIIDDISNEIPRQYLNATKAKEILGWAPQFSLEEGLDRTIKWYKDYFHKDL